jgi:ribosomal-protein-alanine acetyltransferase
MTTLNAFQVRVMEQSDLPAIAALEAQVMPTPWSLQAFRESLQQDWIRAWVLTTPAGQLVGYLILSWTDIDAEILTFAVHPDRRRQGVGQRLLATALDWARDQDIATIRLEVRMSNLTAQHFYSDQGFTHIGRRRNYYQKPTEDALIMARPVTKA